MLACCHAASQPSPSLPLSLLDSNPTDKSLRPVVVSGWHCPQELRNKGPIDRCWHTRGSAGVCYCSRLASSIMCMCVCVCALPQKKVLQRCLSRAPGDATHVAAKKYGVWAWPNVCLQIKKKTRERSKDAVNFSLNIWRKCEEQQLPAVHIPLLSFLHPHPLIQSNAILFPRLQSAYLCCC